MFNEMEEQTKTTVNWARVLGVFVPVLIVVALAVWGVMNYSNDYRAEQLQKQNAQSTPQTSLEEKRAIMDALNSSTTVATTSLKEKRAIMDALNAKSKTSTTSTASLSEKRAIMDALNKK